MSGFTPTKRCVYCHRLSPVNAPICVDCGHSFAQSQSPTPSEDRLPAVISALPPRAGHHPGLHPEDQPFQSSMMEAFHPHTSSQLSASSAVDQMLEEKITLARSGGPDTDVEEWPDVSERGDREVQANLPVPLLLSKAASLSSPTDRTQAIPREIVSASHAQRSSHRMLFFALVLFCLALLFIGSLASYMFLHHQNDQASAVPHLSISSDQLPVRSRLILHGWNFTPQAPISLMHDASASLTTEEGQPLAVQADSNGIFDVSVIIPDSWAPGTHHIYANDLRRQIGAQVVLSVIAASTTPADKTQSTPASAKKNASGLTFSSTALSFRASQGQNPDEQVVTVQNVTDQEIAWSSSAHTENAVSWLSVSPESGRLAVGARKDLTIHVQSQQLQINNYRGSLEIKDTNATEKIKVRLTVADTSTLVVPNALTLTATTGEDNTSGQSLLLKNSGAVPLDWSVSSSEDWLKLSPDSGHLEGASSASAEVEINATNLKPAAYRGTLTFSYNGTTRVTQIYLTVGTQATPGLSVTPTSLSVSVPQGSSPAQQTITLNNPGNTALNWSSDVSYPGGGSPFVTLSENSGSLAADGSVPVRISLALAQAKPGVYTARITFSDRDGKASSQSVSITVTVTGSKAGSAQPAPTASAQP